MRDADSLPYLDPDKLLKECLQIVDEHFRLWYRPFHRLPHSKAIVSQTDQQQFNIYFPESRRWLSVEPQAFTSTILHHYRDVSLRVALWSQLPVTRFLELLRDIQRSGVTLVCCHEEHSVLQFHADDSLEAPSSHRPEVRPGRSVDAFR